MLSALASIPQFKLITTSLDYYIKMLFSKL
ncbi:uncharacterized protein FFFS_07996 [Fusarium fujikuroi]|nr:uncharacterized protein FFFS_07996 [Fusarium fujikuroi]